MQIKAVIFDLDGTLLDTQADLANAANYVLRRHGYPEHPLEAYRLYIGGGAKELIRRAAPERIDEELTDRMVSEFKDRYAKVFRDQTAKYPGIDEMLDLLNLRGIPCAVLTNKPHEITVKLVESYFPCQSFACVLGQRPDVPPKPDPTGANAAIAALGCEPQAIALVGDSGSDMLTAARAGIIPIGALWGYRDREELLSQGAAAILERPGELEGLL